MKNKIQFIQYLCDEYLLSFFSFNHTDLWLEWMLRHQTGIQICWYQAVCKIPNMSICLFGSLLSWCKCLMYRQSLCMKATGPTKLSKLFGNHGKLTFLMRLVVSISTSVSSWKLCEAAR